MSSSLALATHLVAMDDSELIDLVTERHIDRRSVRGFFDLADALLSRASIDHALALIPRSELALLAAGTASTELTGRSIELALANADGVVLPEVHDVLVGWPAQDLPGAADLAEEFVWPSPISGRVDSDELARTSAELALLAVVSIAELVIELEHTPLRELAKGGLSAPESRRMADLLGLPPEQLAQYVTLAARAGLVERDTNHWRPSAFADQWLTTSLRDRWQLFAHKWRDSLGEQLQHILQMTAPDGWAERISRYLAWLYPGARADLDENTHSKIVQSVPEARQKLVQALADAELLGLAVDGIPVPATISLLTHDEAQFTAAAHKLLPAGSHSVYVQADLSVVSTGPMDPVDERALRRVADIERRGLAPSYRVSASSIERALALGDTADSILAFLTRISLSGVPQPLEYLLKSADARFGSIAVRSVVLDSPEFSEYPTAARSIVESDEAELIAMLVVDQTLVSLGFAQFAPGILISRFPLETVYWDMLDAKHPVVARDAAGAAFVPPRFRAAIAQRSPDDDKTPSFIARLRQNERDSAENRLSKSAGAPGDSEESAWIARQLDAASKSKTRVKVEFMMPDGSIRELFVVPVSLSSGRVRTIDETAGVERTLPLASIKSVSDASGS